MKHLWRIVDVGEYDSVHQCYHCKKKVMVSIDNPDSRPPEDGCIFPQEAVRREYARLMANIRGLEGKIAEDFWNKYVVNVYDNYPFLRSENVEDAKNLYFDHLNKKSDITIVYLEKSDINQHYSPVLFHVRHSDGLALS